MEARLSRIQRSANDEKSDEEAVAVSSDPFQGCFNFVAYTLLSPEMRNGFRSWFRRKSYREREMETVFPAAAAQAPDSIAVVPTDSFD